MAKVLKVVGPLATPYREDGSRAYLYEGAEWPEGAFRKGETERFRELGLVDEVEVESESESKAPAKKTAASKS